jgi:hypothetical protein
MVGKTFALESVVKDVAEPLMERLQLLDVSTELLDMVATTWFQVLVAAGIIPPKATPNPLVEKMLVLRPVQLIPSGLDAIVFVPSPTATHIPDV